MTKEKLISEAEGDAKYLAKKLEGLVDEWWRVYALLEEVKRKEKRLECGAGDRRD